ncbi:hypothetical protein N431DRAFT_195715 [Stipitochalara longipes BDJ]|nr:hypothetical protein N431DRAFT_195715 [Stipitochalara longipes BDJ]
MGTKDLIGAASATIAKFLWCWWCVIMISEGAPGQAVQRRAVSVLGGVHAGIKGIWAMPVEIELLEGLQRTDGAGSADGKRRVAVGDRWGLRRSRVWRSMGGQLEVEVQLYTRGLGRSRKGRYRYRHSIHGKELWAGCNTKRALQLLDRTVVRVTGGMLLPCSLR